MGIDMDTAKWCPPCKRIAPIVHDVAADYAGKVKVAKMNIDDSPATPGRYAVRAIPTILAIKGGEVVGSIQGPTKKSDFTKLIDDVF